MGNIEPLKDPDTHILIKTYKEKEVTNQKKSSSNKSSKNDKRDKSVNTKSSSKRSTDSLTKAGFELFENLRQLRLTIAREEGMPPYIVFNDKTLIDMCIKTPKDRESMLNVSGVGAAKYEKYGERFIDAISNFIADHPGAVTNIQE